MALDVYPFACPLGNNYRYGPVFNTGSFFDTTTNATIGATTVTPTIASTFKVNGLTDTPGHRERRFFTKFRFSIQAVGGSRAIMSLINDSLVSGAFGGGVAFGGSGGNPGRAFTGFYNGFNTVGAQLIVVDTLYIMEVDVAADNVDAVVCTTRLYTNAGVLMETLTSTLSVTTVGATNADFGAPTLYCLGNFATIELLEWYYQSKNALGYGACFGPAPTYSAILPSSTGKISKALLLKGDLTPALAETLHNQLKNAT